MKKRRICMNMDDYLLNRLSAINTENMHEEYLENMHEKYLENIAFHGNEIKEIRVLAQNDDIDLRIIARVSKKENAKVQDSFSDDDSFRKMVIDNLSKSIMNWKEFSKEITEPKHNIKYNSSGEYIAQSMAKIIGDIKSNKRHRN